MLDGITDIVPLVSIVIATCAAFFAFLSAKNTKDAANANLASNLLNEYSSDEMSSSIRLIIDYFNNQYLKDQEQAFLQFKIKKLATPPTIGDSISPRIKTIVEQIGLADHKALSEAVFGELDKARRKIHWHYKSVYKLYEKNLIDRKVLKVVTDTNGYEVFCNIVIRMSRDIHPGKDAEQHFQWFDEMKKGFPPKNL